MLDFIAPSAYLRSGSACTSNLEVSTAKSETVSNATNLLFHATLYAHRRWLDLFTNGVKGAFGGKAEPYIRPVFGVVLAALDWLLRSPKLFEHMKKRGIPIVGFVVNDEEDWNYCLDQGISICTDYPDKLKKFAAKRRAERGDSPIQPPPDLVRAANLEFARRVEVQRIHSSARARFSTKF